MLIKAADDQKSRLEALEARAREGGPNALRIEQELRARRAGERAEREAAYLIDFDYAASPNWAVIHDLRIEHAGRVAQIDHLLINRWMDIYALETKSFHSGVKINDDGEFLRWNNYRKTYEGMASPLQQSERHIQVLRDVVAGIALPTRLGVRIAPAFHSFVLVSPNAKIYRPKRFDTSRVIKADQLKKAIWRDIDSENGLIALLKTAAKIVSGDTIEYVARQLAALHQPQEESGQRAAGREDDVTGQPLRASVRPDGRIEPTIDFASGFATARGSSTIPSGVQYGATNSGTDVAQCACKSCRSSEGSVLSGRYGYYFKCAACGTNTAIRFTCAPGHTPRLRGERGAFYRECAQCGSSELFHRNGTPEAPGSRS
ncbi:nuclease-related domain-containing protein [Novilysobacter luteus]|uniref:NERD domain-containing protein n=1 Tax=Novilysobacter luteus TaxID=2822368 RepID=A0ABN7R0T9_9GAMM|nr:nuclease-related domain-containing protein [Lysobacter luteus]CAG4968819.1 hypothetical protein LYB30171_00357 [Lysobacter luteus]